MGEGGNRRLSQGVEGSDNLAHELSRIVEARSDGKGVGSSRFSIACLVVSLSIKGIVEYIVEVVWEVDRLDAESLASLQIGAEIDNKVCCTIPALSLEPLVCRNAQDLAEERSLGIA